MAEHGDGDDLVAVGLGPLDRGQDRLAIDQRVDLAEQVEHAQADARSDWLGHGRGQSVTGPPRWWSARSRVTTAL